MKHRRHLLRDRSGASAVEFALVAPFLAMMSVGLMQGWEAIQTRMDTQAAIAASVQYYMQGGVNDSVAREIALQAWEKRTAIAEVAVSRFCKCGDVVVACSTRCAGGSAPQAFVSIKAIDSLETIAGERPSEHEAVVRIR